MYVKELDMFLRMKVFEKTPAVLSLGKLCDENGYSYEWINGQKPHLIQNGIRIQCNTEDFVPIVFPGLSKSSSGSDSSTSRTLSRQGRPCSTSSSSSSSSPTTATESDSETRARDDPSGIDSHPALLSSSLVERNERGDLLTKPTKKNPKPNENEDHEKERCDPLCSDIPEWLQEFRENLVDDRVPDRDSHASSHEASLEPTPARSVDLCKHSVYTHFPND